MDEIALRALIQGLIGEAVRPLRAQIEALENQVEELQGEVDTKVGENHYHDGYASVDHVERTENSVSSQLYRLHEDLANVEYSVGEVRRIAENAQRNSRGYY